LGLSLFRQVHCLAPHPESPGIKRPWALPSSSSCRREFGADGVLPIAVRHPVPGSDTVEKLLPPKALVRILAHGSELNRLAVLKDERTNHAIRLQQIPRREVL